MEKVYATCAGCQGPTDTPVVLGVLIQRPYCPVCIVPVGAHLKRRDVAHELAAKVYQDLAILSRGKVLEELPAGARLPDEP